MTGGQVLLLASSLAVITGCEGDPPVSPPPPAPLPVTVFVAPSGVGLTNGATLQMHASSPEAPHAVWSWGVNDSALATISVTGVVTARHVGDLIVQACIANTALCGSARLSILELASPSH